MNEHPAWERMRRRAEELDRRPPVEAVASFLHSYVTDEETNEDILRGMRTVAASTTRGLERDLRGLDALLSQPQVPGVLSRLIADHAGWSLPDKSDEAAAALLREWAEMLRGVIAEAEQKRRNRG